MAQTEYGETCSCGATLYVVVDAISAVLAHAVEWRKTHQHDMPIKPVSTNAKGDFGYVRYAQGVVDDDEEEDDE